MDIDDILNKMNIPHRCSGNREFGTLGLTESEPGMPFCTFVADVKYADHINKDAKVILADSITESDIRADGICIVNNPRGVFFGLHNFLAGNAGYKRKDRAVEIGNNCDISRLAHIAGKNVKIGNNVIIEEFVSIKENVTVGDNCIIRAGSIIGGEGFEFKRDANGNLFGVRHLGGVVIKDHAEIQQTVCIDKAVYPWDNTVIGEYTKIDNFCHIAHGVKIGKNTMIVANSGIGGRVTIGDDVWIGFGVTIRNGMKVGNRARANMGAVVTKDIGEDEAVTGNFAVPHDVFMRALKAKAEKFSGGGYPLVKISSADLYCAFLYGRRHDG